MLPRIIFSFQWTVSSKENILWTANYRRLRGRCEENPEADGDRRPSISVLSSWVLEFLSSVWR
jgi:hypothetical protein